MEVNSVEMTLTLSQEKKRENCEIMPGFTGNSSVSISELSQLIGRLALTAIAFLPAPLQYRAM